MFFRRFLGITAPAHYCRVSGLIFHSPEFNKPMVETFNFVRVNRSTQLGHDKLVCVVDTKRNWNLLFSKMVSQIVDVEAGQRPDLPRLVGDD